MARKIDPIVRVLEFFESASIEAAGMALALCKAAVKRRTPAVEKVKRARRKVAQVASAEAPKRATLPPAPDVVPLGQPRRRAKRAGAEAGVRAADVDVPLPGIGPAVIGE